MRRICFRSFLLLSFGVLLGCGPVPPPIWPDPDVGTPIVPTILPYWDLTLTVIDQQTTQPLADALVRVEPEQGDQTERLTDGAGFAHVNRKQGETTITVTRESYEPWTLRFDLLQRTDKVVGLQPRPPPPPPPPLPPPVNLCGRLRVEGRTILCADGRPFRWRGATAFDLVDQIADGREAEAIAFLAWAQKTGFTLVRTITMGHNTRMHLAPVDGQRALPRLLALAAAHDLYVEVVALVDTRAFAPFDRDDHVRHVGRACEGAENCAGVELTNENAHPSQMRDLQDEPILRWLSAQVPTVVLVAWGSNCCGQADEPAEQPGQPDYPIALRGGHYLAVHRDRSRDKWNQVRRVRELERLSAATGRYVVDDEPIGAGEVDEPGRRETDPDIFFTQGVLSRIMSVGSTFHFEDGLRAQLPAPTSKQQAAAEAFIAGARLIPAETRLTFHNAGWESSPVFTANWSRVVRVYTGVAADGQRAWTVALGLSHVDPQIAWRAPWGGHVSVVADRREIRVLAIRR